MGCQSSTRVKINDETKSNESTKKNRRDSMLTPILQRRKDFQWFWCRTTTTTTVGQEENENENEWIKFSDVENEIVEDGFNQKKIEIDLDGNYRINFIENIRFKNDESKSKQIYRIKRFQYEFEKNSNEDLRFERFSLPIPRLDPNEISLLNNNDNVDDVIKLKGPTRLPRIYWTFELDQKNKTMANLVEDAAQGIVKQGIIEEKFYEAQWLSEQLLSIKHFGNSINALHYFNIPRIIGETCLYIYTKESFWYKFIYQLMKNPDVVTLEQLKIIGGFCHLLHWFMNNRSTQFKGEERISTVYRSLFLRNDEERRQWMKTSMKFLCFTSTTKNRQKAERIGNTLLILDLDRKDKEDVHCGTDLSFISSFPHEDEYLIWPGTDFFFVQYEFDSMKKKHFIYLNSSPYTYL